MTAAARVRRMRWYRMRTLLVLVPAAAFAVWAWWPVLYPPPLVPATSTVQSEEDARAGWHHYSISQGSLAVQRRVAYSLVSSAPSAFDGGKFTLTGLDERGQVLWAMTNVTGFTREGR